MKIIELKLYARSLEVQKEFYTATLGLPIMNEKNDSFSVRVGESVLTFIAGKENSSYHLAINIPSFQIKEAYKWIQQKAEILDYEGEEIIDFKSWNAESLYFYDPSKNIVEFIARKNLNLVTTKKFLKDNLLSLSEIGIPTSNIKKIYDKLSREFGLEIFDGDFDRFCAIGDENGLLIVINYEKKKWFPTMESAQPYPFGVRFENQEGEEYEIKFDNDELKLV
jgi:catechol-2,3-dioxygenase